MAYERTQTPRRVLCICGSVACFDTYTKFRSVILKRSPITWKTQISKACPFFVGRLHCHSEQLFPTLAQWSGKSYADSAREIIAFTLLNMLGGHRCCSRKPLSDKYSVLISERSTDIWTSYGEHSPKAMCNNNSHHQPLIQPSMDAVLTTDLTKIKYSAFHARESSYCTFLITE